MFIASAPVQYFFVLITYPIPLFSHFRMISQECFISFFKSIVKRILYLNLYIILSSVFFNLGSSGPRGSANFIAGFPENAINSSTIWSV